VGEEVEVVKINILGTIASFQTVFDHGADAAAGTVFENDLWTLVG
jgi:hypothetical protein